MLAHVDEPGDDDGPWLAYFEEEEEARRARVAAAVAAEQAIRDACHCQRRASRLSNSYSCMTYPGHPQTPHLTHMQNSTVTKYRGPHTLSLITSEDSVEHGVWRSAIKWCKCTHVHVRSRPLGLRVRVHAFASVNPRAVDASVQHVCLQAKEMENCSTWLSPRCVNAPTETGL